MTNLTPDELSELERLREAAKTSPVSRLGNESMWRIDKNGKDFYLAIHPALPRLIEAAREQLKIGVFKDVRKFSKAETDRERGEDG